MTEHLTPSTEHQFPISIEQQHMEALDDIEQRFASEELMHERGGKTCFPQTIAFTHPKIAHFYKYKHREGLPNLLLYAVAEEAANLSGEEFERDYFGRFKKDSSFNRPFTKLDLELALRGAKAMWFGTVDEQSSPTGQEGYNHIIGIVPYRSPLESQPVYMVNDTSGHIDFEPQGIDALFEGISSLPHGERYMQSVFTFRDGIDTEPETVSELEFFSIQSS